MPRLFVAIDLDPEQASSLASWRDDSLNARWMPEHQYHLTLRFVGEANDEVADRLAEALTEARGAPFELSSIGMDVFPSRRRPRVLVVRVAPNPELIRIQTSIDQLVVDLGLPDDKKAFNPHITIARFRMVRPQQVREYLVRYSDFRLPPATVRSFHLYRSDLSPKGAKHSILETYPLYQEGSV